MSTVSHWPLFCELCRSRAIIIVYKIVHILYNFIGFGVAWFNTKSACVVYFCWFSCVNLIFCHLGACELHANMTLPMPIRCVVNGSNVQAACRKLLSSPFACVTSYRIRRRGVIFCSRKCCAFYCPPLMTYTAADFVVWQQRHDVHRAANHSACYTFDRCVDQPCGC